MITITTVTTETGSVYELKEDADGRFWFRGNNVESPTSVKLTDKWYEVRKPDRPVVGAKWMVESIYPRAMKGNPDRIEGGGKYTSYIQSIETSDVK